jgi:N-acetylmuramoyl-L-alanine amidase CwlA
MMALIYKEFLEKVRIDNCIEYFATKYSITEQEVKEIIYQLCEEGRIKPDPNTNTK